MIRFQLSVNVSYLVWQEVASITQLVATHITMST